MKSTEPKMRIYNFLEEYCAVNNLKRSQKMATNKTILNYAMNELNDIPVRITKKYVTCYFTTKKLTLKQLTIQSFVTVPLVLFFTVFFVAWLPISNEFTFLFILRYICVIFIGLVSVIGWAQKIISYFTIKKKMILNKMKIWDMYF